VFEVDIACVLVKVLVEFGVGETRISCRCGAVRAYLCH
jgi:hypothetical protein